MRENPHVFGVVYATEKRKKIDYFRSWIEEHSTNDSGIFLMELEGKPIGMGIVRRAKVNDEHIGYMGSLGVLREFQGKGLGVRFLEYRLNWIKNNTRFRKVVTIIGKANKLMLSLAKRYGFKIMGEGKYHGIPEYYLEVEV